MDFAQYNVGTPSLQAAPAVQYGRDQQTNDVFVTDFDAAAEQEQRRANLAALITHSSAGFTADSLAGRFAGSSTPASEIAARLRQIESVELPTFTSRSSEEQRWTSLLLRRFELPQIGGSGSGPSGGFAGGASVSVVSTSNEDSTRSRLPRIIRAIEGIALAVAGGFLVGTARRTENIALLIVGITLFLFGMGMSAVVLCTQPSSDREPRA